MPCAWLFRTLTTCSTHSKLLHCSVFQHRDDEGFTDAAQRLICPLYHALQLTLWKLSMALVAIANSDHQKI